MKKYRFLSVHTVAIVLFILTFCDKSHAQIHYGVRAGVQLSNASDTPSTGINLEDMFSFAGGGFVSIPVIPGLYLQPEIIYLTKGVSYSSFKTTSSIKLGLEPKSNIGYLREHYFEIPILAKVQVLEGSQIKPYILSGPSLGIWLSGNGITQSRYDFSGMNVVEEWSTSVDGSRKTLFELSLMGGIGVEYVVIGSHSLFFEVRYLLGLTNTNKNFSGNESRHTNRAFCFWLGFSF